VDNAVLLIAGAVVISAAGQMCTDPRVSKHLAQRRKLTTTLYALYGAMSVAALIAFVPRGQVAAFGAFAAVFGWIGLGVLAFVRFSPPQGVPPRFLHVGAPDLTGLVAIAAGMAQAMLLT
jgi:membrane associated rhomboid family serine protease